MEFDEASRLGPRSIGELLDHNFRLYRQKFSFVIISGVCFLLPYHILNAYINAKYHLADLQSQLQQLQSSTPVPSAAQFAAVTRLSAPGYIWALALAIIYSLLVTPLLYGTVVHMTTKHYLNQTEVVLGDASVHAFHRLLPSIVTTILLGVCYFAIALALFLVIVLLTILFKPVAVLISVMGIVGIVCVFIWLSIRCSLVPSIVIEEKQMLFQSIVRSWKLTQRSFWRLFGYFILLFILVGVLRTATLVAATVFIHNSLLAVAVTAVIDILIVPFFMLGTANIYTDLRVRKDAPISADC